MENKFHVGEQIRKILQELQLSQTQLADKLGKKPQYVNRLLGYEFVRSDVIIHIMHALKLPASYIFPFYLDKKIEISGNDLLARLKDKETIIALMKQVQELEEELRQYKS